MNTNPPLYLSYTDAENVRPFFQALDGKDAFELIKVSAPIMGRVMTTLHVRGQADDPPLEIVCVTDKPFSQATADALSQAAIDFAMEVGLIPMRRKGE